MADIQLKIVIRGLPFEATREEIIRFFDVDDEFLTVPTWPDSGRCKGVAFVECASIEEKERLQGFEGQEFEADGNRRVVSIRDFEERSPRNRGRRNRRQNNVQRDERSDNDDNLVFTENSQTDREVYVSNVSFDATEDDFHSHFGECGEIEEVTIPTLYTSGRPKGFAFVRFTTQDGRNAALKLDGTSLINRTIGVRENRGRAQKGLGQRRERRKRQSGLSEKPPGCTTVFVGNLPWTTDEDDLMNLFSQKCGPILSARIVRQSWTKRSRGFGYVEFQNEADVDSAVQLQLTIADRELRLDYAENLSQE